MAEFFAFIFLVSLILLILGLKKPKYAFMKNKKKVLQVYLTVLIISFFGVGITADPNDLEEPISSNEETSKIHEKTFEPDLKLLSKIVDDKLELSGETNLPNETILLATLKDSKGKDIIKVTTVKEGKFKFEPIPINQLKTGNQTIEVTLDEKQPDSVVEVIGEKGKFLTGSLVNDENILVVTTKINIPSESAQANKANNNKVSSKSNQKAQKQKQTHTSGEKKQISVTLVETIDGDTIKVIYNGEEKNVRYLLIDTPETNHPRLGAQPFGKEAKERNRQLVNSGKLTIEFDVGERVDKYGRLLAYVYVDGKSVLVTLLKEGLARVAYVYPPNTRYLDEFRAAENIAKEKKIGIWSIENYVTDSGFNSNKSSPKSSNRNTSSQKSSSYSNSRQTNKSSQSTGSRFESYQNCTELRKVYPNGVPSNHPAYEPRHDRDKDGWACER